MVALPFLRASWNAFSAPTVTPLRPDTHTSTLSAARMPSYSPASKSNRPGASIRLYLIPPYSTGTTEAERLVVPSSTRPIRSEAPEK